MPLAPIDGDWGETNTVYFPGFADLSTQAGHYVQSNSFFCLGHEWMIRLYPRGLTEATKPHISIYLFHESIPEIRITFVISVERWSRSRNVLFTDTTEIGGEEHFCTREAALALTHPHGVLSVDVKMEAVAALSSVFPENPSACKTVQNLFMDETCADIIFEVWGERTMELGREGETPATFFAHHIILRSAAPQLAELCMKSDKSSPSRIEILNASHEAFKSLLLYIYGCDIPGLGCDIAQTKEIIEMADKYGVTNLKLKAEFFYVQTVKFDLENIGDCLLFADAMNCALLKEAVMNFIVKNATEINAKKVLKDILHTDFLSDALAILAISDKKASKDTVEEFSNMSICDLRLEAQEVGLGVDGTRQMLISNLETYYRGVSGIDTSYYGFDDDDW